jgi:hypothetical protein
MPKRYQRGNQNKYIKEEQATQCPKDTKEVIRISISKRNRQRNAQIYQRGNQNKYIKEQQTTQCLEDTKEVIRISISKRNRKHNAQKIPKR